MQRKQPMPQKTTRPKKSRPKKLPWRFKLRQLACSLKQELLRPRSSHEWCSLAVAVAGWVPGLKAATEIASAGLALCKRDYLAIGLCLTALLTGTGEWMIVIQLIRKGQKLIAVARFSARIVGCANRRAQLA